jgi:uncharacterized protein (UPF0147 family)
MGPCSRARRRRQSCLQVFLQLHAMTPECLPVQVYKGVRRGVQQVAVKRLTAVTDPLLLNAIRKEISILQRVSFDRNVVQVHIQASLWRVYTT